MTPGSVVASPSEGVVRDGAAHTRHDTTRHDAFASQAVWSVKPFGRAFLFSLLTLVLLLAAAVMLVRHYASTAAPSVSSPPKIGSLAPDFTLTDLDGTPYQLSRLRGKKVLLNFLCGCPKCGQLAPEWERIHRQHPGVVVLGISTLHPDALKEWGFTTGVTFPLLFDPNYTVASQYTSTDCPRSWVLDRQGKVVYASRNPDDPIMIARTLRQCFSNAQRQSRAQM